MAVLSLAVNLGAVLVLRRHGTIATLDADEQEYWNLADLLRRGGIGALSARRTVPFPLILAVLRMLVGDNYLPVQLALSAVLSLLPVVLYWLVRDRVGDERVARVAALGVLLWPLLVWYGATIYSDSTALLVFVCFLLAFSRAAGHRDRARADGNAWLLAGGLLGLSVLMKPLYLLYTPIALLIAFASTGPAKLRARAAMLLTIGCVLTLAPWSLYLSVREGRFVIVTGNDGEALAGGLNPALLTTNGQGVQVTPENRTRWIGPGKFLDAPATGYLSAEELQLPYMQLRELLGQRALGWIRSHPRDAAYLTARKLLYMWGLFPVWNGMAQTILGNCLLLPLMGAAVVTLVRFRRRLYELAMFWTLPVFCSLVAIVSWGSWRFRMPGDVGLLVLAATLLLRPSAHTAERH